LAKLLMDIIDSPLMANFDGRGQKKPVLP
jgi:hypothetical protein